MLIQVVDLTALASFDTTGLPAGFLIGVTSTTALYQWSPAGVAVVDGVLIVAGQGGQWLKSGGAFAWLVASVPIGGTLRPTFRTREGRPLVISMSIAQAEAGAQPPIVTPPPSVILAPSTVVGSITANGAANLTSQLGGKAGTINSYSGSLPLSAQSAPVPIRVDFPNGGTAVGIALVLT